MNARRCLYADGRIPHLMYEANGQDMSLFILEGDSREPAESRGTTRWSRKPPGAEGSSLGAGLTARRLR